MNEGFMDKLKSTVTQAQGTVGNAISKYGQAKDYVGAQVSQAGNKIMAANKAAGKAMPAALQRMTGDYSSSAAGVAQGMEKKGFGTQYQPPSAKWEDKLKEIETNPAIKQYAKAIAAGWASQEQNATSPTVGLDDYMTIEKVLPLVTSFAQRNNNTVTSAQIGQYLAKNSPTIWSNTTDKRSALRTIANELKKQGITVDNATPTAAPASSTPGTTPSAKRPAGLPKIAQTQPGAPTPAEQDILNQRIQAALKNQPPTTVSEAMTTIGPKAEDYAISFRQWADNKFKTKDPTTYETLTMDQVRGLPGMKAQLDDTLTNIIKTRGTPQQLQFVEKYAMLATAGMQALGQMNKNKKQQGVAPGTGAAQVQLKQKLRAAGITDRALDQVGQILRVGGNANFHSTGNVQVDALLLAMGLRPE
jgi:hypothetical protein